MRLSAFGRFAFLAAAVMMSACDSRLLTGADAAARVRIPLTGLHFARGLAAQTGTSTGDAGVTSLRIVISVVRTGQLLLDKTIGADDPSLQFNEDDNATSEGTLTVDFRLPANAEGETFVFEITAFDASGAEIFKMGPTTFQLSSDGRSATATTDLQYVGPGKDVTSVLISPRSITVVAGQSTPISCVGNPGSVTVFPYRFNAENESIATVDNKTSVRGVSVGTTRAICLQDVSPHAQDAINITVTSAGTPGLTVVSGGGQSAPINTALPAPIKVLVRGASGVLATGVTVQFQVTGGGGQVNPASQATLADGTAQANWTLGSTVGQQALLVTVPSLGFTITVNATGTSTTSGSITGTVRNAGATALSGILLELRSGTATTGTTLATQTTASSGAFTFSGLTPGQYTITASGSGFSTQSQTTNATTGQTTTLNFTMAAAATGSVSGTVTNAANGAAISGAAIEVRSGSGVISGPTAGTGSTTSAGAYTVAGLAAGTYTVRATASGFAEFNLTITVAGGQTTTLSFSMSPIFAGVSIVLNWGPNPPDLDSHLFLPDGSHVYFGSPGSCTFACLQNDEQGGFGPETMIISQTVAGTYTFQVHDYTNCSGTPSALAASSAIVKVYVNSVLTRTFTVPNLPGVLWSVFTLTGPASAPTINAVNTMSATAPANTCSFGGSGAAALRTGVPKSPPPPLRKP
jgi:hypothetical protein